MSQVIQWSAQVESLPSEEGWEMYSFGADMVIGWSDNLKYRVWTERGTEKYRGQLSSYVLPTDAPKLTEISCKWFCYIGDDLVMYLHLEEGGTASINTWN